MAILAECPRCHNKQSTRNKLCSGKNGCGLDLDKAKRSKKVRYWIQYRLPNGKQKKEFVGKSIEDARNADAGRKTQKRENRLEEILDIQAEAKMTFNELAEWWLDLASIKARSDAWRLELGLNRFNEVFGDRKVRDVRLSDLKNYQAMRKVKGLADRTIDAETHDSAKAMIRAAWQDGQISTKTWKAWEQFKKLLSGKNRRSNKRERVLEIEEYYRLLEHLPRHLKPLIEIAMFTGARKGELVPERNGDILTAGLTWDKINFKAGIIKLDGKTGQRVIPMCDQIRATLKSLPRPLYEPEKHHVYTYQDRPLRSIRTGLRAACEKAGIAYGAKVEGGFVFRDLRRSAKTLMARAGVDKAYRDAILGHEPQDMDSHYMRPSGDDLKGAMAKYGIWLKEQDESCLEKVQ
jgi:integrase